MHKQNIPYTIVFNKNKYGVRLTINKIPLIDLKLQYQAIQSEIDQAVKKILIEGEYISGQSVKKFEQSLAKYLGVKYAISCSSGTDALIIALEACGLKTGDEVITPALSFFATAESIARVGAKPVFADVYEGSCNINVDKLEQLITKKTKAILPVHLYGQAAEISKIIRIAKVYKLKVIEDSCQSVGAEIKGKKVGTFGDAGCFSFFPTKNLGCYGDGGMIVTNSEKVAVMARALREHGNGEAGKRALSYRVGSKGRNIPFTSQSTPSKYDNYIIGYNSRLDEIQAAALLVKLKYLDKWNNLREKNAEYFSRELADIPGLETPSKIDNSKHVFHLYVLKSPQAGKIRAFLAKKGIATGVYYPTAQHLQRAFDYLKYKEGDFPIAEYISRNSFAIPVYPELTLKQKSFIVKSIKEFFSK